MNKLTFFKALISPFKPFKPKFYCGRIAVFTPYFFPRKWVKIKDKPGYMTAVSKKIGFDFVGLGWKTKWEDTDYRFEHAPLWSFVFFKWQIAVMFIAPQQDHYWEAWLYYHRHTDKSKSWKDRIEQCRNEFHIKYKHYRKNPNTGETTDTEVVDYYNHILKSKYLK